MPRFDPRYEDVGPKPTLDLFGIGTLEEQLDSLSQVGGRLFDRCPLAGHVQLRAQCGVQVPSFPMIAVYTVVAIPILPAATEMCSAAHPMLPGNAVTRPWSVCARLPECLRRIAAVAAQKMSHRTPLAGPSQCRPGSLPSPKGTKSESS